MTKDQAIQIVNKRLQRHQPEGYRLQVFMESSHQEEDWWIVSVGPDQPNIPRYDYYNILSKVEQEIEDDENEPNISLVPPPSSVTS